MFVADAKIKEIVEGRKSLLYLQAERNQYFLPKITSPFCRHVMLKKVS